MPKILVTGGAGFLGSHICEYYKNKGWEVIAYDNLTKYEINRSGYNTEKAREYCPNFLTSIGVKLAVQDVRDYDSLLAHSKGCDYIVHCAAQPAMTIAIEDPRYDFTVNAFGTQNAVEVAGKLDVPLAICSTIHVYGNGINKDLDVGEDRFVRDPPVIDESQPTLDGEITPLHTSKFAAELCARYGIDTYGRKIAIFRLTGMYGPRQLGCEDHGWVANFAIRTELGLPIKIFGTDKQVRDILYVKDAVEAFDSFYFKRNPGIYNIGGGLATIISLKQCLSQLSQITGKEQTINLEPARTGDLWYFACDSFKAYQNLNWIPRTSNKKGLDTLCKWVRENKHLFI